MTDQVLVALISGVSGMVSGSLGKASYDRWARLRHGHSSGNGSSVENVIARRAEVEFQTRMTLLLQQAVDKMETVASALTQAAMAIREVHEEIVKHAEATRPAIEAVFETKRAAQELLRKSA